MTDLSKVQANRIQIDDVASAILQETVVQEEFDKKQDVIANLSTIENNATDGKTAYNTIANYGDIVTYNANDFASSDLVPNQASSTNQLADKEFVNSSIATATATFKGTYDDVSKLPTTDVDDNDYAFVTSTDEAGNTLYNRYKYNGTNWVFEYTLNNSSFTASQWNTINSGATSEIIDSIATKANDSDVVHNTGNETISGNKIFTTNVVHSTTASGVGQGFYIKDTGTNSYSIFEQYRTGVGTDNETYYTRINHRNTNGANGYFDITSKKGDTKATIGFGNLGAVILPSPDQDTTTSTQADTVGARNRKLQQYRTLIDQNVIDATKQNISTALNYKHVSNCITEIPQDIKLELNDGTLTLKAGSKVYVPNGPDVFDIVTISSDISITSIGTANIRILLCYGNNSLSVRPLSNCTSGDGATTRGGFAYDTTDNRINYYNSSGEIQHTNISLPIAIIASNSYGKVGSIDQIFNGFGYIGSTVFALPSVKGLYSNGRNADGTLINVSWEISNVLTMTLNANDNGSKTILVRNNKLANSPSVIYDENKNVVTINGDKQNLTIAGNIQASLGTITSFTIGTPFHAVDYNDFNDLNNKVVHITDNEEISGDKTFTARYVDSKTKADAIGRGFRIVDSATNSCSIFEQYRTGIGTDNEEYYTRINHKNTNGVDGFFDITSKKGDDKASASFTNLGEVKMPTPTVDTTTSNQADTVGARNTKLLQYRTLIDQNVIDATKQNKLTAGTNITIDETTNTISANSGLSSVSWGDIKGVLSNQSDLQNALNEKATISQLSNKADNNDVVHKTGNESISGTKTFTKNVVHSSIASVSGGGFRITDSGTNSLSMFEHYRTNIGLDNETYYTRINHRNTNGANGYIDITSKSGDSKASASFTNLGAVNLPTPIENTTTSTQADTVGARNTKLQQYRTLIDQNVIDATKQPISTALNYNHISNCITEIPQDIKLELNDGTLTLKAGSKVYVPNGTGVFDTITTSSDISATSSLGDNNILVCYYNSTIQLRPLSNCVSGAGVTTISGFAYDTTTNTITYYNSTGTIILPGCSLPICIITSNASNVITSIDQIFNGFGYIGSTIFALPGVKGLIPNGINVDGSLNNIEITVSRVLIANNSAGASTTKAIGLSNTNINYWSGNFESVKSLPTTNIINYKRYYVIPENIIYTYNGTQWIKQRETYTGQFSLDSAGSITSFTPKTQFRIVDYNDLSSKQDKLVSGTNIKTLNNESLLGNGNIDINSAQWGNISGDISNQSDLNTALNNKQNTLVSGTNIKTIGGNSLLGSGDIEVSSYHPSLLSFQWTDHILNEMSWLRADTFSWQSGDVYTSVYNLLVAEYQNGTTETEESITFKRSPNGYKITTDESSVSVLFNSTGVAWYYILDTANRRFKLPRTKYGFTGLRDSIGNYVPESLPNIKGTLKLHRGDNYGFGSFDCSGAFSSTDYSSGTSINQTAASTQRSEVRLDLSQVSSTYQDNAPVQQRATQMYLYFYVGEFSQTAIEQTAGITTEQLNGKVDTSSLTEVVVLKTTYVNGTSGYNIYSNGYCEQWGIATKTTSSQAITFVKPFRDTNINIQFSPICPTNVSSTRFQREVTVNSYDTNGFNYTTYDENAFWKACGYLAEGEY